MPSTYKRDKPWDTDDIDKWKVRKGLPNAFFFKKKAFLR